MAFRRAGAVLAIVAVVAAGGETLAAASGTAAAGHGTTSPAGRSGPEVVAGAAVTGTAPGAASPPVASSPAGSSVLCPEEGTSSGTSSPLGSATHLSTRTTGDGVTIRVYRLTDEAGVRCGPLPGAAAPVPAPGCGFAPFTIELSDATAVGQGFLDQVTDPASGTATGGGSGPSVEPLASSSGAFGVVEGAPVWWVALDVGGDVARVTVTFTGGSTDSAAPVDGVVALAAPVPSLPASSDPSDVGGSMQFIGASGSVLATVPLAQAQPPLPTPLPDPAPLPGVSPPSGAGAPGVSGNTGAPGVSGNTGTPGAAGNSGAPGAAGNSGGATSSGSSEGTSSATDRSGAVGSPAPAGPGPAHPPAGDGVVVLPCPVTVTPGSTG